MDVQFCQTRKSSCKILFVKYMNPKYFPLVILLDPSMYGTRTGTCLCGTDPSEPSTRDLGIASVMN